MVKKLTLLFALVLANSIWAQSLQLVNASLEERYALRSTNNHITLEVKNNGDTTISFLEANWNDGESDHTAKIRTNIPAGKTVTVKHPVPVNYSDIVEKHISVSLNSENASPENVKTIKFNTVTRQGTKGVLIEEATGTWCQWCTGGIVNMEVAKKNYPDNFVGVAVHGGRSSEPMKYKAYLDKMGISGFPNYNVDRVGKSKQIPTGNENAISNSVRNRKDMKVPADLFATGSESGGTINITAKAKFFSNFTASDFKMGIIVIEDGVTGTSRGYAQQNAYAGGGSGKMGGYENKPRTIPASQMVYDHVARYLLGGYNGQAGSVPANLLAGDEVEYTFSYKIGSNIKNKDKLHFALVLIKGREVVNAKELSLKELSTNKFAKTIPSVKMYPNPAKEHLNISFDAVTKGDYAVTVYDMLGRVISENSHKNLSGLQKLNVSTAKLSKGSYLVSVSNNEASYSQVIIVE